MSRLKTLFEFSRPLRLALAALTYLLGMGIARYLGRAQNVAAFWLGLGWALLIFLALDLLTAYFRPPNEPLIEDETPARRNWLRAAFFQVSVAALGAVAVLTVLMLRAGLLNPPTVLFLVLAFLAALAYALPPLRLVNSGFGELTLAILLVNLLPALAFLLQTGEFHRLLAMVTFPLTALALAFFLVLDFPAYAADAKYRRRTLLTRIGWQRAIPLHHILVLTAYLLFAAAPLLGFPWAVIWPVFLTFPFALLQIFWMRHIALGGAPNWKFLTILASSVIGLTIYSLMLTFWTR
ncbi:MAG: UbiA family prenyltransferase [Chloroflexi bacterium]|nr:UbiA family prenyltransferase [Chloroflexota bacterium]